jgi:pimeloyl-ACP methyl ester carboxylesterase
VDLRPSSRRSVGVAPTAQRRLLTVDGVVVSAAYDKALVCEPDLCFVVAHGFTGSWARPDSRRIALGLSQAGAVVSLDLRGHGRSGGASTVGDAEVRDVSAGVGYARWLGYRRIVTVGFSMGGSVVLRQAALAAQDRRPDAVVSVSSAGFWFYQGTAPMRLLHRAVYSRTGRSLLRTCYGTRVTDKMWLEPYPLTPADAAAQLAPVPLLVVHGARDPYFPREHAEAVVVSAHRGARERGVADNTSFWWEPGLAHAESATGPELVARIGSWAREHTAVSSQGAGR